LFLDDTTDVVVDPFWQDLSMAAVLDRANLSGDNKERNWSGFGNGHVTFCGGVGLVAAG
jgi:hypothetical protein